MYFSKISLSNVYFSNCWFAPADYEIQPPIKKSERYFLKVCSSYLMIITRWCRLWFKLCLYFIENVLFYIVGNTLDSRAVSLSMNRIEVDRGTAMLSTIPVLMIMCRGRRLTSDLYRDAVTTKLPHHSHSSEVQW